MKGRDYFRIFRYLLRISSKLFGTFPDFILNFMWGLISSFDGAIFAGIRYILLSAKGAELGDNVYIGPMVLIKNPAGLKVGDNVSIHSYCYIDAIGGVTLGNNVSLAHSCSLISFNHCWDDLSLPIKYNNISKFPIIVADDVWVGCAVRILAGCSLESRSVFAAGTIVTEGSYAPGVYAGVPARFIKAI